MKRIIYSIATILLTSILLTACDKETPIQEPEYTVNFQSLPGYWVLNNYETHTKSNNNTIILNTNLDGSLGIDFDPNSTLRILENDTLQADGTYTIHSDTKRIKLSELILAEGIEPEGTAKILFPIISNNTVDVGELVEGKMTIIVTCDASSSVVAHFIKKQYY